MSRNDDYRTGILLDYLYHQKYYKLTGIDLSRKTNTTIPQQDNFTKKIKGRWRNKVFLLLNSRSQKKAKLVFRFINCHRII